MSQTAVTSAAVAAPRTVTLHNGQILSFKSNISTNLEKIPVIDATNIWSQHSDDRQAVAEEIREASRTIGFFYLVNHVRAYLSTLTEGQLWRGVWLTMRRG